MTNPDANLEFQAPILTSRPKVLHIISGDLWAGAEVQAYTLLTSLCDKCELLVVLMNDGELADRLRQAGISVEIIDEHHCSSLKIFTRVCAIIRRFAPDLIHTHRQKENILGAIANTLASRFLRKYFWRRSAAVRTTHGAPEHSASGIKKIQVWLDHLCGNYLQDAIISVSTDLATKLRKIFPNRKIHIIENGIDVDRLQQAIPAADIRTAQPHAYHIGIVGRLEPVKRVDIFLNAAQQLLTQTPNALHFHVIGDGKLAAELRTLAHSLGLAQSVSFHGHRTDPAQVIAALDMVVICSDHEGTPMTALETLALGKPLIAHSVGGLVEILADYPELLVTDHSPTGYSNKMLYIMQTKPSVQLKKAYTNHTNAAATLALYQKLIRC